MKLKELMTHPIISIPVDSSIAFVAKEMHRTGHGFMPVVDHGRAVGVVTGKDLSTRAAAKGLGLDGVPITVVMSYPPVCLHLETDLYDGLVMMRHRGIRRILVTDDDEQLIGIVSLADVETRIAPEILQSITNHHLHGAEQDGDLDIPGLYLG